MNTQRNFTFFDKLCLGIDQAVRALSNNPKTTDQPYPAKNVEDAHLTDEQRKHSASLMRINHAGEICAQALYHGQGMITRSREMREKMQHA
ncbi:MAG TPA: demethoxyubiquinone hydroxylase family protein, partial [Gammaproteobacteria bacterium]|nr:demethoxyubiquinone hydroxylase family protein [Gammaproteobacteria bacterium]